MPQPSRDPFAPIDASPRGGRLLAVIGLLLGLSSVVAVPIVLGPAGMVFGLVAHVKRDRFGMPAAVVAGIGTVIGMTLLLLFDNPFRGD